MLIPANEILDGLYPDKNEDGYPDWGRTANPLSSIIADVTANQQDRIDALEPDSRVIGRQVGIDHADQLDGSLIAHVHTQRFQRT